MEGPWVRYQQQAEAGASQPATPPWEQFQQQADGEAPPQQDDWRRGMLAPVERNDSTGERRWAVPQVVQSIIDAIQFPGDVAAGRVPDMDPRAGVENMSDESVERVGNLAGLAMPITPGSRYSWAMGNNSAMNGVERKASNRVLRALSDDQIPANQVQTRIDELGPEGMLMDLGPNVQQRAGGLASVPGPARQNIFNAVEERAKAAGARVNQDVQDVFGTGQHMTQMLDDLSQQQTAAAAPLYDAIRPVPVQQTPAIQAVMQTPLGQQAFKKAQQMAANDGVQGPGFTVGTLDYAKRALDDFASAAFRAGRNNEGRQAQNMARALRGAVDEQVPAYAAARDTFAGYSQLQDALTAGQEVFGRNVHPAEFKKLYEGMTASEKEAMLQGARTAIEHQMGTAVNEPLKVINLLRQSFVRKKLETLLGEDEVRKLIRSVTRERAFGDTRNVVTQNSQTAARQAAQHEASPELRRTNLPSGLWSPVLRVFDAATAKMRAAGQQRVNEEVARLLSSNQADPRMLQAQQDFMLRHAGGIMTNYDRAYIPSNADIDG